MSLESRIQSIFARAGRDVVAAIRESLPEEVRHLTAGGAASARPVASAQPAPDGHRRNAKQIAAVVAQLLAFVREHPGLGAEQIVKGFGGDVVVVKDALARLRATKKVRTVGIKRAMRYRAA